MEDEFARCLFDDEGLRSHRVLVWPAWGVRTAEEEFGHRNSNVFDRREECVVADKGGGCVDDLVLLTGGDDTVGGQCDIVSDVEVERESGCEVADADPVKH